MLSVTDLIPFFFLYIFINSMNDYVFINQFVLTRKFNRQRGALKLFYRPFMEVNIIFPKKEFLIMRYTFISLTIYNEAALINLRRPSLRLSNRN